MRTYLSDAEKLSQPMGQFENWYGKLFYWSGPALGWRYLRGGVRMDNKAALIAKAEAIKSKEGK